MGSLGTHVLILSHMWRNGMTRTERRFFFIFGNTPANRHDTFGDLRNLSTSLAYIPDGRLSLFLSHSVCVSLFLCTYHARSLDGVGFGREATQRARGFFHARLGGHLILVLFFSSFLFYFLDTMLLFFSAADLCCCGPDGCDFVLVPESRSAG